ncbi:MAG: cyclophilin-like fold protein [Candidatus Bathyarchaeota archaeon]|nr:cyclophilin-like fold protein [Candidatus Bathyarchaeota archaeon]
MSDVLSKIPIKITIVDKGEAKGILNRLTAPLTVGVISNMLPINSRTSPAMGFISIIIGIERGTEKPVNAVNAGTIAYWPRGDAIGIYPKDFKPYSPVNKIGEITEGLELFTGLRSGSRIIIEKISST